MSLAWKDPNRSLGERCIAFAENEMKNGVAEDKPNSFTSPRLREYFAICTRLINGKETNLNFKAGNWCAAGVSFSLHESLLPGDIKPHGYRLGVVEVVDDVQKRGFWRPVSQARQGSYQLNIGDIIIFDRSKPGDPSTAWWRHIGRVYDFDNKGNFTCLSGNNGGKWRLSKHTLSQATLLGFGEYPGPNVLAHPDPHANAGWINAHINDIVPAIDSGQGLAIDDVLDMFDTIKD
jgi:hypothetical protein